KITYLEAKLFKRPTIGTEHLLLSILKDEDNVATRTLMKFSVDYETVREELETLRTGGNDISRLHEPRADFPGQSDDDDEDMGSFSGGGGSSAGGRKVADTKSKTPVLDNFGRDLTKMAEEDKLDPIVGREKEIE